MRYLLPYSNLGGIAAVCAALLCQGASGQSAPAQPAPAKAAPTIEAPADPPRSSTSDYQGHATAGAVTIAAEFTGHSVVTPLATFTTEEYVAVDVGLFGPPGAHLRLSHEDFSLRINGKRAVPSQMYLPMFKSLKDPEYVPPEEQEKKKDNDDAGVPIVGQTESDRNPKWHPVPFEVQHRMEVRVEKASLPEGDRALPAAGLIFFSYGGREKGITSVELVYEGPAGRAIVPLHP
jgi:hypothetical protein